MIVCDICKSNKCFSIEVPVVKIDNKNKKKTVITAGIDLCDHCLTIFLNRLGHFVKGQRNAPVTAEETKREATTLEESTVASSTQ